MNLLEKAQLFNKLTKIAGVKEDMAKRIFISLLNSLVPEAESARVHLTKGIIDYNVLKELLPGARDLVKHGSLACFAEITHIPDFNHVIDSDFYREVKEKIGALYRLITKQNYTESLQICKEMFEEKKYWVQSYGGTPWAKIAFTLFKISSNLDKYKSLNDEEDKIEILKDLLMNMNVLDGLCHNTSSVMNNIIEEEHRSRDYDPDYISIIKDRDYVKKLLDTKQLENPGDVWEEIRNYITPVVKGRRVNPQSYLKDWVGKADSLKRSSPEYRQAEYKFIRDKKIAESQMKDLEKDFADWKTVSAYDAVMDKIGSNFIVDHFRMVSFENQPRYSKLLNKEQYKTYEKIGHFCYKIDNELYDFKSYSSKGRDFAKKVFREIEVAVNEMKYLIDNIRFIPENYIEISGAWKKLNSGQYFVNKSNEVFDGNGEITKWVVKNNSVIDTTTKKEIGVISGDELLFV